MSNIELDKMIQNGDITLDNGFISEYKVYNEKEITTYKVDCCIPKLVLFLLRLSIACCTTAVFTIIFYLVIMAPSIGADLKFFIQMTIISFALLIGYGIIKEKNLLKGYFSVAYIKDIQTI